jgi:alkaline phosphatase D
MDRRKTHCLRYWLLIANILLVNCQTSLAQTTSSRAHLPTEIRILSYNIHHGEGIDGKIDLPRIATILRESQADIIALQEVDRDVARSGRVDQAQVLADLLDMHLAFGGNISLQGGEYGNAILSRFPIHSFQNSTLPNDETGEQRGVLRAEIAFPDSIPLVVLSTHFDHRPDPKLRVASVKFINELVLNEDPHSLVFLAGDLNAVPSSSVLAELDSHWVRSTNHEHPTIPVENPTRQIDYVLWRNSPLNPPIFVRSLETRVLAETIASDHRAILTTFELSSKPSDREVIARIAFGSCIKQDRELPIFDAITSDKPDLMLFLGDNIYADTSDVDVLRRKYQTLRNKSEFRRLTGSTRVMATWDDHDFGKNDGGADFDFRQTSQREFLNFWEESSKSLRRDSEGIYESRIFGPEGKRLQVILLDTRYFRSPLKKGPVRVGGPYIPDDDQMKTMLGEPQWIWLEKQLREPAEARLLVTSIQCIASDDGQETWSNLPHERKRLLDLLMRARKPNVVLLSGDRHWSELSVLQAVREDGQTVPIYELTSSSFNQVHERGTPTVNHYRAAPKTYHRPNYGFIEIDWSPTSTQLCLQIRNLSGVVELEKHLSFEP